MRNLQLLIDGADYHLDKVLGLLEPYHRPGCLLQECLVIIFRCRVGHLQPFVSASLGRVLRAGLVAAAHLATQNRRVVIIERQLSPGGGIWGGGMAMNDVVVSRGGTSRVATLNVVIDGDKVTRNPAYCIIAHASKFVRPGSVRIASNSLDGLPNVAFKNPAGQTVLIVLNRKNNAQTFNVRAQGEIMAATLPGNSVGTFVW